MTREEARLAVRHNAEVIDRNGIHGYAYSLMWFHFKGKEPYEAIGYHDLNANCVYQSPISDPTVTDLKIPDYMVQDMLANIKVKTD